MTWSKEFTQGAEQTYIETKNRIQDPQNPTGKQNINIQDPQDPTAKQSLKIQDPGIPLQNKIYDQRLTIQRQNKSVRFTGSHDQAKLYIQNQ